MKLTPQPGLIFVEHVEPAEVGLNLAVPLDKRERRTGRIVATGEPEKRYSKVLKRLVTIPMELSVDEYVLFKRHTADVLSIAGRTIYVLKQEDVELSMPDLATFQQLILSDHP